MSSGAQSEMSWCWILMDICQPNKIHRMAVMWCSWSRLPVITGNFLIATADSSFTSWNKHIQKKEQLSKAVALSPLDSSAVLIVDEVGTGVCVSCANVLVYMCAHTCVWTPARFAVLWVCEVRGLKEPLKCYELYWSEVPRCIDYKPYETRQAVDLKPDFRVILTGGILPFYFCSTSESLFCKCYFLLSVPRRFSFSTHAILAGEWQGTLCDNWEVKPGSGQSGPFQDHVIFAKRVCFSVCILNIKLNIMVWLCLCRAPCILWPWSVW